MKHTLGLLALILGCTVVAAQSPKNFAVQMSASVVESPTPSITLTWNADKNTTAIQIFRKAKDASTWSAQPYATPAADAVDWTDTEVEIGIPYEYRVIRDITQQIGVDTNTQEPIMRRYWAFGYLLSGIKVPPALRGRVLILVDSTVASPLQEELDTLVTDLQREGWTPTVRQVARREQFDGAAVEANRQLIKDFANQYRNELQHILIIGRVAIPYSGDVAPDGHVPDHRGAWPADGIYGDLDGSYTDQYNDVPNTQRPVNSNIPGDGKYDQSLFGKVEIAVGRVDFYDMPQFEASEVELLRQYFHKNHAFRSGQTDVAIEGVVDDHFGGYGEYFAATAWRSFPVFGGYPSVKAADWFTELAGPKTYLWAYGCGGGSNTSANGVGTTADFASKPVHAIHAQLFGSYFGDWNTRNNLLRASIAASPYTLTCGWAGRPAWYMHHMGLGEPIGYSLLISQNNRSIVNGALGTYTPNVIYSGTSASLASIGDGGVHIALMGDPTLRAVMEPVPSVTTVVGSTEYPNKVNLSWEAPTEGADGYMVFRYRSALRGWELLTPRPITETALRDSVRSQGDVQYRVHAVGLRQTYSGSYYDMGQGAVATVLTTGVQDAARTASAMHLAPNPAASATVVQLDLVNDGSAAIDVVDATGTVVLRRTFDALWTGSHHVSIDLSPLPNGAYRVCVRTADGVMSAALHVLR